MNDVLPGYFKVALGLSPLVLIFYLEVKSIREDHQRFDDMLHTLVRRTQPLENQDIGLKIRRIIKERNCAARN